MLNVAQGVGQFIVTALVVFIIVWGCCYYFFPKARVTLVIGTIIAVIAAPQLLPLLTRSSSNVPYLENAVVIDGVQVKGAVEKWENGKLRSGILEGDQLIQGWPAADAGKVSFDPNGDLFGWTAARTVEVWGKEIPAGSEVLGTPAGTFVINVFPKNAPQFEISKPKP